MLKKILIAAGILVVLLIVAFFYLNYRNRTLSPPGETSLTNEGLTVEVTYSRPSVRDRVIFGPDEDKALVPYGKYWRLGANEATEITFSEDVLFAGKEVKKGTYRMYAIPGKETFEIRLNSELGQWGALEPDYTLDVEKIKVPVEERSLVEQFTISTEAADGGVDVIISWEKIQFKIPVRKK